MKKRKNNEPQPAYHPVDSVFEHEGTRVRVVSESENNCEECYFNGRDCREVACIDYEREDETDVHFEEEPS